MSALSILFLVLPLPIAFLVHRTEELIIRRHNALRRQLAFAFAETLVFLAVTCYVLVMGPGADFVWGALFMGFAAHLLIHIVHAIRRRAYTAGLASAIILLPLTSAGFWSLYLAFGYSFFPILLLSALITACYWRRQRTFLN